MIRWGLDCRGWKQGRKNKPITAFVSRPCDWLVLPFLLPAAALWFSLDHGLRSRKRNWKKWKWSDSSDSNSVVLMTPLTTLIFAFHYVIRGLMTPTKTPTPTPSQVKTSLKYLLLFTFQWLSESSKALTKWSNFTNVIMDETVSLLSKGFFKVGHIRWICTLVMQFYLDYWWNCKQFCLHLKPTPYCRWLPWNLLQI